MHAASNGDRPDMITYRGNDPSPLIPTLTNSQARRACRKYVRKRRLLLAPGRPAGLVDRGVYIAPFLVLGQRYLYAADQRGEKIADRMVPIGVSMEDAVEELWGVLDGVAPSLAIVRE
jgi:hypothetical protein